MGENTEILRINGITLSRQVVVENNSGFSETEEIKPVVDFLKKWWDDTNYVEFKTSGSTGDPKRIRISKNAMRVSAGITNRYFALSEDTVSLLCLPVAFIAGSMMIVRALEGKYSLLAVQPDSNPFKRPFPVPVTFCACTPMQLATALKHTVSIHVFKSISTVIIGGGEIAAELEEEVQEFPNQLFATYGMTETITHMAVRRVNGKNRSSMFTVLPDFQITTDERDCLVIRAPHLDQAIITNDVVRISGNSFEWKGRADHVINSGGLKFIPEELEKEIAGLIPYTYLISSVPDTVLGNKLVLVVKSDELTEVEKQRMLHRVNEVLTGPKKLHELRILGDFPRTATGKIKRNEILVNLVKNKNI